MPKFGEKWKDEEKVELLILLKVLLLVILLPPPNNREKLSGVIMFCCWGNFGNEYPSWGELYKCSFIFNKLKLKFWFREGIFNCLFLSEDLE